MSPTRPSIHWAKAPRGHLAIRTACGVNVRGAITSDRELVECKNCLHNPADWTPTAGYHYRKPAARKERARTGETVAEKGARLERDRAAAFERSKVRKIDQAHDRWAEEDRRRGT